MATTRRKSTRKQQADDGAHSEETRTASERDFFKELQTVRDEMMSLERKGDIIAELQTVRDDMISLERKAAAAEERAFHMQASITELRQKYDGDLQHLKDTVAKASERLNAVEQHGRRLFKTLRNEKRSEMMDAMKAKQMAEDTTQDKGRLDAQPQDEWATLRAASMIRQLEDAGSDIGSCVSSTPRFW